MPDPITVSVELPQWLTGTTTTKSDCVEIQLNLDDTLPQLKETLEVVPKTENLANYDLVYGTIKLFETFDELATFAEILQGLGVADVKNLKLKVSAKPYNLASVYEHLVKFRQVIGLHFLDKQNQYFGVGGGSSKFSDLELTDIKKTEEFNDQDNRGNKEEKNSENEQLDDLQLSVVNSIANILINPEIDLSTYGNVTNPYSHYKSPIKSLSLSPWNPVSHHQKLKGDLLYLTLQTLENETFHITCGLTGFYINGSSNSKFNPERTKVQSQFILFNLVRSVSSKFEKTLTENTALFPSIYSNPESYLLPSATVSYPWIVKEPTTKATDLSSQLNINNGVDGADFVKDWNEEFQSIKELDRSNINERILREKLLMKTIIEFNQIATKTAIEIVNGNISSMNINSNHQYLTYLRNGIFYSFAVDASGSFASVGGDEASRYVASKDLNSIRLLNRIDTTEVHTLLTCVVDYMGKRIICQAPVPGIFQDIKTDEKSDKVVYGLNSENTDIVYDEKFHNALTDIAEAFHLKPHSVELDSGIKSPHDLALSKDVKGIYGTDGRKYLIDLFRTTPLDVNFDKFSNEKYPHKETLIRHEALEEWWKRKIAVLFKLETERLEAEAKEAGKELDKDQEKPNILIEGNQVSVNADAFTGINEKDIDQNEVQELSEFILILIDEFLNDTTKNLAPFDGGHLSVMLHRAGINLRYLGYIANQCVSKKAEESEKIQKTIKDNEELSDKLEKEEAEKRDSETEKETQKESSDEPEKEEPSKGTFQPIIANYQAIYETSITEMISRGVKHVLRKLSNDLPIGLMPYFVSHVFNCLLGSDISKTPKCEIPQDLQILYDPETLEFTSLTTETIVKIIEDEVFARFNFSLPKDWINTINHTRILRQVSIKFGIQWKVRKYYFSKEEFETQTKSVPAPKKKGKTTMIEPSRETVFIADDIVSFVPILKDSTYKSSILDEILETAQKELTSNNSEAMILFNELLTFHEQIYGRVHGETASYYGYLSQLYSEMNLDFESSSYARIACILSERLFGIDSYNTVTSYINSGYFEASQDLTNSLKLYTHAIKVWTLIYGPDHPSVINTFANLAESLSTAKAFTGSFKLFEKAIDLCTKVNGEVAEITGLIYYRYGSVLINSENFKAAKEKFHKAYDIFVKVLGPTDQFTKKSLNFKTNLTTYLDYQKEAAKKGAKPQSVPQINSNKPGKKNKKGKKKTIKVDETIASKSVDDILAFIEGK